MKRLSLVLIMGIALCVGGQSLFAGNTDSRKSKKEQKKEEVKERLDSGNYTIDVDRALPMSGRSVNLTSLYTLEIKGDSVISYLPYFGRAYSVPYGGGDGLHFKTAITDYSIVYDKKRTARIQFKARTDEDNFSFNVQVFSNGTASINVTPVNRQSIGFHGELNTEKKEKTD